ncbi:MAG: hypothetical protein Q7U57_09145 [Methylovulum sp.]|nr:hypothetical protein [Methylovulum sp.]
MIADFNDKYRQIVDPEGLGSIGFTNGLEITSEMLVERLREKKLDRLDTVITNYSMVVLVDERYTNDTFGNILRKAGIKYTDETLGGINVFVGEVLSSRMRKTLKILFLSGRHLEEITKGRTQREWYLAMRNTLGVYLGVRGLANDQDIGSKNGITVIGFDVTIPESEVRKSTTGIGDFRSSAPLSIKMQLMNFCEMRGIITGERGISPSYADTAVKSMVITNESGDARGAAPIDLSDLNISLQLGTISDLFFRYSDVGRVVFLGAWNSIDSEDRNEYYLDALKSTMKTLKSYIETELHLAEEMKF